MTDEKEKIITSQSLTEEMNAERRKKGLPEVTPVNSMRGSTNTMAMKDKSWSSVPDFFSKFIKK